MVDRDSVLQYLTQNKVDFASRFHLSKIGIFGSLARGDQSEASDIDLIVEFQAETPNLFEVKDALRKVLEQKFQVGVDICREKYIKPYFKDNILRDAIFV